LYDSNGELIRPPDYDELLGGGPSASSPGRAPIASLTGSSRLRSNSRAGAASQVAASAAAAAALLPPSERGSGAPEGEFSARTLVELQQRASVGLGWLAALLSFARWERPMRTILVWVLFALAAAAPQLSTAAVLAAVGAVFATRKTPLWLFLCAAALTFVVRSEAVVSGIVLYIFVHRTRAFQSLLVWGYQDPNDTD
jgi:hypothetical protein